MATYLPQLFSPSATPLASAKDELVSLRSRKEHWPLSTATTNEFIEELKLHKSTLSIAIFIDENAALFHSRLHEAENGTVVRSMASKGIQITAHSKESVAKKISLSHVK